jgi:DNA-directed RNA polymerase sigma subunit (sigma70/sigma32)
VHIHAQLDDIERDLDNDIISPRAAIRALRRVEAAIEQQTMRAASDALGMSKSRLDQIERIALRKARRRWVFDAEYRCLYPSRPGIAKT